MAKWCGLLPLAMWAGSIGVPAHALQVSGPLPQGPSAPLAYGGACEDPLAFPPAGAWSSCGPAWPAGEGGTLVAFASTGAAAPLELSDTPELGQRVAEADLDAVRGEGRGNWATQLLAGLVTVGVVAHRRLAWRARGMALSASHAAGTTLRVDPARASSAPPPPTGRPHRGAGHAALSARRGA